MLKRKKICGKSDESKYYKCKNISPNISTTNQDSFNIKNHIFNIKYYPNWVSTENRIQKLSQIGEGSCHLS